MNKRKLIVNADDFGQSEGINRGIILAHEKGIVTSASLMVRYPAAKDAAAYARKNHLLGVGLHIDLGEWMYIDEEWKLLYEVVSLEDVEAVKNEISKQLENFYKLMDREPTHIDSHQHVHLRDNIRSFVMEFARSLNVNLRGCNPAVKYCGEFYGQTNAGLPFHDAISVEGLQKTITKLPGEITELACHPGLDNDVETMYKIEREIEVSTLCDERILESIEKSNIELCCFESITFS